MKKLMIAAAAAAMVGGAFAGDGTFAGVYNLKYTLKTIAPKTYQCGKEVCTICEQKYKDTGFYYENGTVKLEGLVVYCDPCTNVLENFAGAELTLWDSGNKWPIFFDNAWQSAVTVDDVRKYATKDTSATNVFAKFDQVVYGKSSNKVALDTKLQYVKYADALLAGALTNDVAFIWDLRAAGLGSYAWTSSNEGYIKSVSGNVAGVIPAFTGATKTVLDTKNYLVTYWSGLVVDNVCAGKANYCETKSNATSPWIDEIDIADEKDGYVVPAYGTWTMKYNASATKKDVYKSLPSWLQKWPTL